MAFSLFLTAIFFFILFFFGWQLIRYFLKENRIEYLIGFAGISGIGLYVFFVNAISYFIPIKIAFYLVLSLFLISGLSLFYFNRGASLEWQIAKSWRKILLGTALLLAVISSIVYFRYSPPLHGPGGLPSAATIAEGNFPVMQVWDPSSKLNYHYGPDLFSAAVHKTTGLPLYLAFDFQVAILAGVLFLLGFCLIKRFFDDNNFKAFISSLLMIYAGTLSFLKGIAGIPILYNLYIRHQEILTPFKFVGDIIDTLFFVPVFKKIIEDTWGALTFPLIIAVIYLYFCLISRKANKMTFLLCGLLLAVLGQVGETFFAVLALSLFVYPFIFGFVKKDWQKTKDFLLVSFLLLMIALPLAFLQGGVLRGVLDGAGELVAPELFKANEIPWHSDYFPDKGLPIFQSKFWMEFGLLLAVLIPAFLFLLKRNFQLGSFLVVSAVIFFFIGVFVQANVWAYISEVFGGFVRIGALKRFFHVVNLIGGLAAGLFLAHLYLSSPKTWLKKAALFVIVALMAQGLFYQLLYLTIAYPPFTWNAAAKHYAKPGSFEGKAYDWVRKNTTIDDYFLIIEKDCSYNANFTPNYRFVINTGRMAPIYLYHCSYPDNDSLKKIKENCDSSAIENLQYRYLYVNESWPLGLEEKCLFNNDLELKFEAGEEDKFIRIFKVL